MKGNSVKIIEDDANDILKIFYETEGLYDKWTKAGCERKDETTQKDLIEKIKKQLKKLKWSIDEIHGNIKDCHKIKLSDEDHDFLESKHGMIKNVKKRLKEIKARILNPSNTICDSTLIALAVGEEQIDIQDDQLQTNDDAEDVLFEGIERPGVRRRHFGSRMEMPRTERHFRSDRTGGLGKWFTTRKLTVYNDPFEAQRDSFVGVMSISLAFAWLVIIAINILS